LETLANFLKFKILYQVLELRQKNNIEHGRGSGDELIIQPAF